jgi:hypothetical protein
MNSLINGLSLLCTVYTLRLFASFAFEFAPEPNEWFVIALYTVYDCVTDAPTWTRRAVARTFCEVLAVPKPLLVRMMHSRRVTKLLWRVAAMSLLQTQANWFKSHFADISSIEWASLVAEATHIAVTAADGQFVHMEEPALLLAGSVYDMHTNDAYVAPALLLQSHKLARFAVGSHILRFAAGRAPQWHLPPRTPSRGMALPPRTPLRGKAARAIRQPPTPHVL